MSEINWQPYDWRISYFIDTDTQSLQIRVLRRSGSPFIVQVYRNGIQLDSLFGVAKTCKCELKPLSEITQEFKQKCGI